MLEEIEFINQTLFDRKEWMLSNKIESFKQTSAIPQVVWVIIGWVVVGGGNSIYCFVIRIHLNTCLGFNDFEISVDTKSYRQECKTNVDRYGTVKKFNGN